MATFSVDVTDIIFAGGRTGSKTVELSNEPANGVTLTVRGTNQTSFRISVIESGKVYSISTKATNSTSASKTATVRITNNDDSTDYVDINLTQYNLLYDSNVYINENLINSITPVNVENTTGSVRVLIDTSYSVYSSVTSGSDWLSSVQGTPSVTDTGFVSYSIAYTANHSSERTGQVQYTINGGYQTVTIVQEAGSTEEELSVTPSSLSYDSTGGTNSITVTYRGSTYNCDTTEVDGWVNVALTPVITGVLGGTITVSPNTSMSQRSGNVVFSDGSGTINLLITQTGVAVTLSTSPSSLNFTENGGFKPLAVTFSGTLTTNVSNMPSWLSQSYVDVDTNRRTYTITALSNTTIVSRSFDLVLQDDNMTVTVPITQDAYVPVITVDPSSSSVGKSSGTVNVSVTGASDISYTIDNNFLTYSSISGNVYTFRYTANTGSSSRTATVTFSAPGALSKTFTLTQLGVDESTTLTISPTKKTVDGKSGTFNITVTTNISNLNVNSSDWITIAGIENNIYTFNYEVNPISSTREGTITFSGEGLERTFILTQTAGNTYTFTPSSIEYDYLGGGEVPPGASIICDESDSLYIKVTGDIPVTAFREGTYYYCYLDGFVNDSYEDLTGKIEFYTTNSYTTKVGEIPVTMKGNPGYLSVAPKVLALFGKNTYRSTDVYVSTTEAVTVQAPSFVSVTLKATYNTYKVYTVSGYGTTLQNGNIIFKTASDQVLLNVSYNAVNSSGNVMPRTIGTNISGGTAWPLFGGTKYVMYASTNNSNVANKIYFYPYISESPTWIKGKRVSYVGNISQEQHYTLFKLTASNTHTSRSDNVKFSTSDQSDWSQSVYQQRYTLGVNKDQLLFNKNGGVQTITFSPQDINLVSTLPSWITMNKVGTISSTSESIYDVVVTPNTTGSTRVQHIIFTVPSSYVENSTLYDADYSLYGEIFIIQSGQSSPEPEPEPEPTPVVPSLKVSKSKLRYYSDGGDIGITFNYLPESGISYDITYSDSSDWLTVTDNGGLSWKVTASENSSTSRRASILFWETDNTDNYVSVTVIQGSVNGYDSIWMDTLYYPENRDENNNYYYRIINDTTDTEIFRGISAKPQGYDGGIDIPRIVDTQINSEFSTSEDWVSMDDGYITVSVINMTNNNTDATFKYWNDWSRFEQKYDYTRYLNDPINGRGCKGMVIPVCVYYDDESEFSYVDTTPTGTSSTTVFDTPDNPFVMCVRSFDTASRVDFKQDDDIIFSYDLSYCGEGTLIYRNRFGGWDSFLIEGNIIKTDNYTKEKYKQQSHINSSHFIDKMITDKVDITTTYEIHTGWLTDDESERLVYHLLSSPVVYFQNLKQDYEQYPINQSVDMLVNITSTSAEYKKFRNGRKLVNYTITFEVSNTQKVMR